MKKNYSKRNSFTNHGIWIALVVSLLYATSCIKSNQRKQLKNFDQVNLVANTSGYGAAHIDPTLKNAWGLAFSPNGIAWVNSPGGHVSELYDKEGNIVRAPVDLPSHSDTIGGIPTGIVFNGTPDFVISNGKPALFLFVGVDGILSGWNPPPANRALLVMDNSASSAYTGLANASSAGANYIYGANFRSGKIDVWDKGFTLVSMPFTDPNLPAGYSPFNIQAVGSWLYVLYAKVAPNGQDDPGVGNGFVSIFNTDGSFVKRFATQGLLNAPWGIAQAPADFFDNNNDGGDDHDNIGNGKNNSKNDQPVILIGNFGDGYINAYSLDGAFMGQLKSRNRLIQIPGLWALSFPPASATAIDPDRLYFTAGPNEEKDGLFGYIIKE